ncbi:peptidoglycan O-acetyltransferase [Lachnospiraceae bacterium]|nr:peptidoglycan O-acetyltransferase [Lachnospiraceae bacterium]
MLFNSIDFLLFFPVVVMIYYIIPQRIKYIWLLAASYYFYMNWNVKYVLLLFSSTIVTYVCGRLIGGIEIKKIDKKRAEIYKKISLMGCLLINLGILFIFKYYGFFANSIGNLLIQLRIEARMPQYDIILPVGISFYTFQALSYTIDVYRGEIYAEKNFLKYALFVSFFPQLVAGPIERSKNLLKQLGKNGKCSSRQIKEGLFLMLWGYFLKIIIADRAAVIVDNVYNNVGIYGGWYLIAATFLFAMQIYCDFAGYSTIAMGAAKILGINLMENFDAPYLSKSVSEFWRRWHISLSSWFKDYLYISLGGNRKGKIRKYINLMIVFCVSGLWHGASWTFILWGGINGFFQVVEDVLKEIKNKFFSALPNRKENRLGTSILKTVVTFCLVDFAWIFFRADTMQTAIDVVRSMVQVRNMGIIFDGSLFELGLERYNVWILLIALLILLLADIVKYKGVCIRARILASEGWFQWGIIILSFWFILMLGIYGVDYDTGQFIYFQF